MQGFIFVLGNEDFNYKNQLVQKWAPRWQKEELKKSKKELIHFSNEKGPVWILRVGETSGPKSHGGLLEDSNFSSAQKSVGQAYIQAKSLGCKKIKIEFVSLTEESILGAYVGLEVASYDYKKFDPSKISQTFEVKIEAASKKVDIKTLKKIKNSAAQWGRAVNFARHLVNLPPNELNPKSFAEKIQGLLSKKKNIRIEIWNEERLKKEKMGLHLGVGQGALHPPRLVKISYRPPQKSKVAPIAFVGKGITFDSGGLDIKPSSGMRLMKKDMGGAAAVAGLALWVSETQISIPLDFYLGLAENSVDAKSMRPSDVLISRNGLTVEVHNTDAEGRLVLADAIDVAVTSKEKPKALIDVATLTGAIKVGLGAEIAGLFSNDDSLAEKVIRSGYQSGDLNWRMPLFSPYTKNFSSPFADMVNATDGFGGAITAALFLEKFVKNTPWAHLDIYAWVDRAAGAYAFSGGTGQGVSCLIEYLRQETK